MGRIYNKLSTEYFTKKIIISTNMNIYYEKNEKICFV